MKYFQILSANRANDVRDDNPKIVTGFVAFADRHLCDFGRLRLFPADSSFAKTHVGPT